MQKNSIRKFLSLFIFSSTAFLYLNCATEPDTDFKEKTQDIFPLKKGNTWVYSIKIYDQNGDSTIEQSTSKIIDEKVIDSRQTFIFDPLFDDSSKYDLNIPFLYYEGMTLDEVGLYSRIIYTIGDTLKTDDLKLKYPANVGDSWQTYSCYITAPQMKIKKNDDFKSVVTCVDQHVMVETDLGKFWCIKYKYEPQNSFLGESFTTIYKYYSVGVGKVYEESYNSKNVLTQTKTLSFFQVF